MSTKKQTKRKITSYYQNKKKRLTEAKKKLAGINKKLKRNFEREEINIFRKLIEERNQAKQDIEDIENDKEKLELDEFVKTEVPPELLSSNNNSENSVIYKPRDDDNSNIIGGGNVDKPTNRFSKAIITAYPSFAGDNVNNVDDNDTTTPFIEEDDYVQVSFDDQVDDQVDDNNLTTVIISTTRSAVKSHTYTPLRDIDDENSSSNNNNRQQLTLKDDVVIPKINLFHERILDYSLITPRLAEKDICSLCITPLIHDEDEGRLSCVKCGTSRPYIDTSNNTGQFFYTNSKAAGSQKINNQFDIILGYFDTEKWMEIEPHICDAIVDEIRRVTPEDTTLHISAIKIRDILKKKKFKKYYRNVVQIYSHLTSIPTPTMTKEVKALFQHTFKMLKIPYEKHKGKRKNFLSYPLTFKKLCKHLGYDEFIQFLDIVKVSASSLIQEKIWEKMCIHELGWDYQSD